jgi:hypothetical protein
MLNMRVFFVSLWSAAALGLSGCVESQKMACTSPASSAQIETAESMIKDYLIAEKLENFLIAFTQKSRLISSLECGNVIILQYEPWTPPGSETEAIGGISEYKVDVVTREVSWKALSD